MSSTAQNERRWYTIGLNSLYSVSEIGPRGTSEAVIAIFTVIDWTKIANCKFSMTSHLTLIWDSRIAKQADTGILAVVTSAGACCIVKPRSGMIALHLVSLLSIPTPATTVTARVIEDGSSCVSHPIRVYSNGVVLLEHLESKPSFLLL